MNCNITYDIIGTGSSGNAVVLNHYLMIDCGLSYKKIADRTQNVKVVLLTHTHSDHINCATLRKMIERHPTLRIGCGAWLVSKLVENKIPATNIDILEPGKVYDYGFFTCKPFSLNHNVPNCGYKIEFPPRTRIFYATDTNDLNGIEAKDYDLYLIEADYGEEEIKRRIKAKEVNGEYAYEREAVKNHLSKEKADNFIAKNAGPNSEFIYMHQHGGNP